MKKPTARKERVIIKKFGKIVFEQEFRLNDGRVENFLLVKNVSIPSIVFPLTVDNKVIVVKQFRYGLNDFVLEFPGGIQKNSEKPEKVVFDELMEETGYRPQNVIRLSNGLAFEPALMRICYIPFLATGCKKEHNPRLDDFEVLEVKEFLLDEWIRMVFGSEINDSKTIAITALALPYLGYKISKVI